MTEVINFGISVSELEKPMEVKVDEVKEKYLTPIGKRMKGLEKTITDFSSQQKFFQSRKTLQNEGKHTVNIEFEKREKRNLYISIFESIIVIILTLWQVYYIKKILDVKQSV